MKTSDKRDAAAFLDQRITKDQALDKAKHNARYRHGEWFAWQHKSGDWYACKKVQGGDLEDAKLNVKNGSKVYLIGGGGPLSVTFTRISASILNLWCP